MRFTTRTIDLPNDYEGRVRATLIQARSKNGLTSAKAALYIHGYIDYFFQEHMARGFTDNGWNFHAVDLRKYGRSTLPHQHAFYCRDIREYFPEIDAALTGIISKGNTDITLIGHSTGGLIASLYSSFGKHKDKINRLILNSPFFEFNVLWLKRNAVIPLAAFIGRIFPYASKKNELSPHYATSVHTSLKGEWDYDLALKPQNGVPLYFAWIGAIRKGQKRVKKGLKIDVPILIIHSDRSWESRKWNENHRTSDTVLNIKHITKFGARLGGDVTDIAIPGALHDVILSRPDVRKRAFDVIFDWLKRKE